jgi:hypothetical protein
MQRQSRRWQTAELDAIAEIVAASGVGYAPLISSVRNAFHMTDLMRYRIDRHTGTQALVCLYVEKLFPETR